jgi:hypothetical protein
MKNSEPCGRNSWHQPVSTVHRERFLFLLLGFFFFLVAVPPAAALQQTVAVFPVADLGRGTNTPNLSVSRYLQEQVGKRGFTVVTENDLISFMAAERVRSLGFLDTRRLNLLQEKVGANLALFGTISQRLMTSSPSFGLALHLVRTMDGKTLWSGYGGLSLADMQHILGLNEPSTVDDIWPVLVRKVLADLPAEIEALTGDKLLYNAEQGEFPPTLQVRKLNLGPRYVQPGKQVKCVVELADRVEAANVPQIFIKVGNRIHLAQQSVDGLFYEASWTGSEIEKGIFREVGSEAINLAATDLKPQFFEGVWLGSLEDATYPVSLIMRWPSGQQQMAFVGNYTVDSTVPEMMLRVDGRKINDILTFNKRISIRPSMKNAEPISRWRIEVLDENSTTVMHDTAKGALPRSFFWRGQGYSGYPVEKGTYQLKLTSWDRAENSVEATEMVVYNPIKPEITLDVSRLSEGLEISMDLVSKDIPLLYWVIEIWKQDGELLKSVNGSSLPAVFVVPMDLSAPEKVKIDGHVLLKNMLGTKVKMNIDDLYLLALRKSQNPNEETTETPEEDDDSWAWLSEN